MGHLMYKVRISDLDKTPLLFSKELPTRVSHNVLELEKEYSSLCDEGNTVNALELERVKAELRLTLLAYFDMPAIFNCKVSHSFIEGKSTMSNWIVGNNVPLKDMELLGKTVPKFTRRVGTSLIDEDMFLSCRFGGEIIADLTTLVAPDKVDGDVFSKLENIFYRIGAFLGAIGANEEEVFGVSKTSIVKNIRDKIDRLTSNIPTFNFVDGISMKHLSLPIIVGISESGQVSHFTLLKLRNEPPFNKTITYSVGPRVHRNITDDFLMTVKRDNFVIETLGVPIELTSEKRKTIPEGITNKIFVPNQTSLEWSS